MGKGDKKSRRGKIFMGSSGKTRLRKKVIASTQQAASTTPTTK